MRRQGPFSREQIDAHLHEAVVPLRLACADAVGHPLVLSLWFLWSDGALWCECMGREFVEWLHVQLQ